MQGMRLYHQPGLSNRVVSALRNRLERVLLGMSADGDVRVHGTGAHGEEGDEQQGCRQWSHCQKLRHQFWK